MNNIMSVLQHFMDPARTDTLAGGLAAEGEPTKQDGKCVDVPFVDHDGNSCGEWNSTKCGSAAGAVQYKVLHLSVHHDKGRTMHLTARQACCVCGGGTTKGAHPEPSRQKPNEKHTASTHQPKKAHPAHNAHKTPKIAPKVQVAPTKHPAKKAQPTAVKPAQAPKASTAAAAVKSPIKEDSSHLPMWIALGIGGASIVGGVVLYAARGGQMPKIFPGSKDAREESYV